MELKLGRYYLEILQQKEEEYLRIRSRSNWLAYGDKNTKYLHHHASRRRTKNHIDGLVNKQCIFKKEQESGQDSGGIPLRIINCHTP